MVNIVANIDWRHVLVSIVGSCTSNPMSVNTTPATKGETAVHTEL